MVSLTWAFQPSGVFGGVDGAGAGDHFGAVGSLGEDSGGFVGEFGREGMRSHYSNQLGRCGEERVVLAAMVLPIIVAGRR
jgi:hypothetical protein